MLRLSKFAQYAASAKAAMTSRDAASTQQNLETINAAVLKLTEIVTGYSGGLLAAAPISSYEAALGQDIKNATADAEKQEVVTPEEADAIIAYITETLERNIQLCMAALKSKKTQLGASNLQTTTLGDLKDLREATAKLSTALVSKAPAEKQEAGKKANALVDADFAEAITFFT